MLYAGLAFPGLICGLVGLYATLRGLYLGEVGAGDERSTTKTRSEVEEKAQECVFGRQVVLYVCRVGLSCGFVVWV